MGGTADGSSLFKGWIDDFRIYSVALQHRDVKKSYGEGAGDFGPVPTFSANRATSVMPMIVNLSFLIRIYSVCVYDLNISDFEVEGE